MTRIPEQRHVYTKAYTIITGSGQVRLGSIHTITTTITPSPAPMLEHVPASSPSIQARFHQRQGYAPIKHTHKLG